MQVNQVQSRLKTLTDNGDIKNSLEFNEQISAINSCKAYDLIDAWFSIWEAQEINLIKYFSLTKRFYFYKVKYFVDLSNLNLNAKIWNLWF